MYCCSESRLQESVHDSALTVPTAKVHARPRVMTYTSRMICGSTRQHELVALFQTEKCLNDSELHSSVPLCLTMDLKEASRSALLRCLRRRHYIYKIGESMPSQLPIGRPSSSGTTHRLFSWFIIPDQQLTIRRHRRVKELFAARDTFLHLWDGIMLANTGVRFV